MVEIIDPDSAPITVPPVGVTGYVDGCQASRVLTYRDHRAVTLLWAAAALLSPGKPGRCLAGRETLSLVCSYADEDWARSLPGGAPVEAVDAVRPWDIDAATTNLLDARRRRFEIEVCEEAPIGDGLVVIDGDLRGKGDRADFAGVVKTHEGVFLADESSIFGLREGWRSPIFRLPASRRSDFGDRFSAYVRMLSGGTGQWWGFGLVRVETRDPSLIDGVAALCMANRQPLGADRRENHLASIAATELLMKSRRPHLFSYA